MNAFSYDLVLRPGALFSKTVGEIQWVYRVLYCDPEAIDVDACWYGNQRSVAVMQVGAIRKPSDKRKEHQLEGHELWPELFTYVEAVAKLASGDWTEYTGEPPFKVAYGTETEIEDATRRAEYAKVRNERLAIVEAIAENRPLCYRRDFRGEMITAVARKSGWNPSTLRKWLQFYWRGGELADALWTRHRFAGAPTIERDHEKGVYRARGRAMRAVVGPSGDRNMRIQAPDVRKRMSDGFTAFINLIKGKGGQLGPRNRIPWRAAHEYTLDKFFRTKSVARASEGGRFMPKVETVPDEVLPSLAQFTRFICKDEDLVASRLKVDGKRLHNLTDRVRFGDTRKLALGPGAMYEIDWMLADIHLVNRKTGLPCGRPNVCFIVDRFSRMLVGLYVTLEKPSLAVTMRALRVAFTDKKAFAKTVDLEIEPDAWPCAHLPWKLLADNAELASYASDLLVRAEICDLANTPSCRGDLKAAVESSFKCGNVGLIRFFPGYHRGPKARCAPDSRLQSTLSVPEFTKALIGWAISHFNCRLLQDYEPTEMMLRYPVPAIPIELWKWGIRHIGGPRQFPERTLKWKLRIIGNARLYKTGLWFCGVCYLTNSEQFKRAAELAGDGGEDVCVAYDPEDTHTVNLWPGVGHEKCEELTIAPRSAQYDHWSFGEVEAALRSQADINFEGQKRYQPLKPAFRMLADDILQMAEERQKELFPNPGEWKRGAMSANTREQAAEDTAKERETKRPKPKPQSPPPAKPPQKLSGDLAEIQRRRHAEMMKEAEQRNAESANDVGSDHPRQDAET